MTIALAWLRKFGSVEELVLASDSRLSGYGRWDCCPKLIALPRKDSAICFSGTTAYAYPVIIQALSAIEEHPKVMSRALDLEDLKGHLLRILNSMVSLMKDLPTPESPDTNFILAGWSWKRNRFAAWLFHFDTSIKKFTFRPITWWKGGHQGKFLGFTGDYKDEFKKRLNDLLRKRKKIDKSGFDMEPFEVLRDMLRSNQFDSIGGAPQVMKVYRHINCTPFPVFWPSRKNGKIHLLGRPLLEYESSQYLVLNPDTLKTMKHVNVR